MRKPLQKSDVLRILKILHRKGYDIYNSKVTLDVNNKDLFGGFVCYSFKHKALVRIHYIYEKHTENRFTIQCLSYKSKWAWNKHEFLWFKAFRRYSDIKCRLVKFKNIQIPAWVK